MSDYEDDDWKPPSEAELKVIAAKRERSDKISKRMGDYLLKGYKMLATSCRVCSTIELQDRQGQKYCVACQEIDCHETSKDDPVLSDEAAGRVIAESAFASSSSAPKPESRNPDLIPGSESSREHTFSRAPHTLPSEPPMPLAAALSQSKPGPSGQPVPPTQPASVPVLPLQPPLGPPPPTSSLVHLASEPSFVKSTKVALLSKLEWANTRLSQEQSIESTTALVILIREIFSTLSTMNSFSQ